MESILNLFWAGIAFALIYFGSRLFVDKDFVKKIKNSKFIYKAKNPTPFSAEVEKKQGDFIRRYISSFGFIAIGILILLLLYTQASLPL